MQPAQIILLVMAIALMAGLIINRLTSFFEPEPEPEPPRWYIPGEHQLEFARRWDAFMNARAKNSSTRAANIEFWTFATSLMPDEFQKACNDYEWQEVGWDVNRPYIVAADRVKKQ